MKKTDAIAIAVILAIIAGLFGAGYAVGLKRWREPYRTAQAELVKALDTGEEAADLASQYASEVSGSDGLRAVNASLTAEVARMQAQAAEASATIIRLESSIPKPAAPSTPKATPKATQEPTTIETEPSDGARKSLGTFEATAYCLTGTTASGAQAGPGKIAVDPRVIPLGTRLYVEGYGECVAVDTGGAIKGRIIDVWFATNAECIRWGRHDVEVWIIQ